MADKLIVKGLNSAYSEPLRSLLFNSFYIQPTVNDSYQMQFTAYDDKSVAFNMLTAEASLIWDGQEFIIKQIVPDYSGSVTTTQVTAVHIGYEISRIFQRSVKTGTLTYTVDQVLSFILSGNELGFTWQVIGDFDKQQITDLGNCTGKDMLSKVVEAWPQAIFWPDNKIIRIYHHDVLAKDLGNRIDYLNNTKEVKLTYDSNELVNKLRCVSAEKDSGSSDKTSYWFDPFYVTDEASIKQFGVHDGGDVSDDRFHDVTAMGTYGKSKLVPDPSLAIEITKNGNDKPTLEEIVRLEIRPFGYVTNVEIVSYQYYPLDSSQPTQITLNNRSRTILNYKQASQTALKDSVENQQKAIKQAVGTAISAYSARLAGTKVEATEDSSATTETLPLFVMKVAADNDDFGLKSGDSFAVQTTAAGVSGLDSRIKELQTNYLPATQTTDGLLTAADKAKLDKLGDSTLESVPLKDTQTGLIYELSVVNGEIKLVKGSENNATTTGK